MITSLVPSEEGTLAPQKVEEGSRMHAPSYIEVAQTVALEFGITLSAADADYVIYEETGFPEFWNIPEDGKDPVECMQTQLRRYFRSCTPLVERRSKSD